MNHDIEMTAFEFRLLREFIHQRFGLYLQDEKRTFLQMKLYSRVASLGLSSFSDYFKLLKFGAGAEKETGNMISAITNTETYFFRELSQLKAFRDVILPELKQKKLDQGARRVRILSAGCSTGEEVFTIAMMIYEAGLFLWDWDIKVMGIDINNKALDTARAAIYYERSLRMTPGEAVTRYFNSNHGSFRVKDPMKGLAVFVEANITDPDGWGLDGPFDVIFCRNVLIYFSEEAQKRAVENFYQALCPGGLLLLGHSETLIGISDCFVSRRMPDAVVYTRPEPAPD